MYDVLVAKPEEQIINKADKLPGYVPMVSVGLNNPTSVTPAEEGLACFVANCGFVNTITMPDNVERVYKVQLMDLQIRELQDHMVGVHGVELDDLVCQHGMVVNAEVVQVNSDALARTNQKDELHESFVDENADITAATIAELEDAIGTTVPNGWTKSSSRSKKSKQRKKSRGFL